MQTAKVIPFPPAHERMLIERAKANPSDKKARLALAEFQTLCAIEAESRARAESK